MAVGNLKDRSACLVGERVSLPKPFLDNKALPASFHSSLRNSRLCLGTHTQPPINDAASLMKYTCPS